MSRMTIDDGDKERLRQLAGAVFKPSAPISEEEFFSGRSEPLRTVIDAINTSGQHVLIFGERGVGKTSLSNIVASRLHVPNGQLISPHVSCTSSDTFSTVWRQVFRDIEMFRKARRIGFKGASEEYSISLVDDLPEKITPGDVRSALRILAENVVLVVVIDEFDRLASHKVRTEFADTIKMLSDYTMNTTLVVVGVGDTVDELIKEHVSIGRALIEVPVMRMSGPELRAIIMNGLERLEMQITGDAMARIANLCRGFPQFAHLLGLHSSRKAIEEGTRLITGEHVGSAIEVSVNKAHQSVRSAYHKAVSSPNKRSLHGDVLLACALAQTDAMGFFTAGDVRDPFRKITGNQTYDIPNYSKHLNAFCEDDRGAVLQRRGVSHRPLYRFANPLMQPFVVMQGLVDDEEHGSLTSLLLGEEEDPTLF